MHLHVVKVQRGLKRFLYATTVVTQCEYRELMVYLRYYCTKLKHRLYHETKSVITRHFLRLVRTMAYHTDKCDFSDHQLLVCPELSRAIKHDYLNDLSRYNNQYRYMLNMEFHKKNEKRYNESPHRVCLSRIKNNVFEKSSLQRWVGRSCWVETIKKQLTQVEHSVVDHQKKAVPSMQLSEAINEIMIHKVCDFHWRIPVATIQKGAKKSSNFLKSTANSIYVERICPGYTLIAIDKLLFMNRWQYVCIVIRSVEFTEPTSPRNDPWAVYMEASQPGFTKDQINDENEMRKKVCGQEAQKKYQTM
ncbi:Hypothetical predicted protein [Paramuricea clavata]|uniref:Uncharacterized protein n=1 Tax=Paramuricea clavata TaxID=317549 RepID=A0A6S7G485_PARCT|nr:Hypothetical predicted protein [Paramuricea clavata]